MPKVDIFCHAPPETSTNETSMRRSFAILQITKYESARDYQEYLIKGFLINPYFIGIKAL